MSNSEVSTKYVIKNTSGLYAKSPNGEEYTKHLSNALLFKSIKAASREFVIGLERVKPVMQIVVEQ